MTCTPALPAGARRARLVAWNWLCHALLALGLVAPCMTFSIGLGEATDLARDAGLIHGPQTYSVLSGILALLEHGNLPVGGLLLCFSVLFPISKLIVVRLVLQESTRGAVSERLVHAIAILSKYSMVDVFVIALLVVASKTAPGSSVSLHWGTFAFAAAALLSMGLTTAVKRFAAPPPGPTSRALR